MAPPIALLQLDRLKELTMPLDPITDPTTNVPIRTRFVDPSEQEPQEVQKAPPSLILQIYQYCQNPLDDTSFFNTIDVPRSHDHPEIHEIYSLVCKIKNEGMKPESFNHLKILTAKVALDLGIVRK